MLSILGLLPALGAETTYTFTSKSWAATNGGSAANWTSGKDGAGFSNNGIQVTTNATGANGTSPISFTNVTKVVCTYNTNKSKGAGTINVQVGSNTSKSVEWKFSGSGDGTSANFTATVDYSTPETGNVKITLNTTTNSIYLVSVTITTGSGSTPSLTLTPTSTSVEAANVANQSITLTTSNFSSSISSITTGLYSNAECTSAITSGAWVKNITVNSAKTAVTFDVDDNDGAQRQCWLKVTATAGSQSASAILPITQVKYSAPTGTFKLFSGDISEGDYVIYYGGKAMNTTVTSNRLQYLEVTPSDNKITNPDESIIWHIAPISETTYWSIYNATENKYAGGTTTSNQATMLSDVTSYASWAITGTSTYQFENYGRSILIKDADKKWLRNNGTYGFACYASSTGGALTLYKLDDGTPSAPTFSPAGGSFLEAQNVTLSAESGTTIYYTTDGTAPSTSSSVYSAAIPVGTTTTIKAIAVKDDKSSGVASATYTIISVDHAGTAADPYSVADARTVIDAGTDLTDKYVHGIVSAIVDPFNTTYHNISYNFSDDGLTTSDQLEAYRGKSYNGGNFTSNDDIQVGDDVIVFGTLKKYGSTYELDAGNQLVKRSAHLAWSGTTESAYAASLEGGNTFPTLTNSDNVSVSYSSSETSVATINASNGNIDLVGAGSTNITATFTGNDTYFEKSASYTLNVSSTVIKADILFEENGGSAVTDMQAQSNLPSPLPTTTKAGYNFGGWFTTSTFDAGTEAIAGAAVTSSDPITLYAKWLDPYTVTEALAIINALADGAQTESSVYVAGIVSTAPTAAPSSGKLTFYISANGQAENELQAYNCKNLNDESFTAQTDIQVGDEVTVFGPLKKYMKSGNPVPEFNTGYLYAFNRPDVPVTGVTLESTASVAIGGSVTLHATIEPSNASNKTINWSVQSGSEYASVQNGVVTGIAEGTAVIRATSDADATKYAECTVTVAPLSPWATVYSSNVTVGAEEYKIKILKSGSTTEYDEFKGQRYGSGSAAGVATINIPANTQTLHFHAAGWNNEDVQLTVTMSNGTVTLFEMTGTDFLVREANVAGNGKEYIIATPTNEYYSIDLSQQTIGQDEEITFTATAGKRFALFGVNQEGGILPVLDHIVVTGDANDKTYDAGDRFDKYDYAGLGANAIYTLSGVEQAPVAIPSEDIEWSSDPEIVGASTASVTVTATYEGKSATKEITGLTVNIPDPEIEVSATALAFGKVAKGATVADKELTVTLRSVENATLAISGAGASAFSLDKYALTATGTVTVSASSATVGTFDATLTISDNAGEANAQEVALSLTVEAADDLSGTWNLVTSEDDLLPGVQVIVAQYVSEGTAIKTMGQQNSNNRAAVESSVSGIELAPAAGTKVLTLVDAGDGMFALQASNGKYLYAAGGTSSNHLKEQNNIDNKAQWTITIDNTTGVATIKANISGNNKRDWMRYNTSGLFSCYGSGQTDIVLYAKAFDYERAIPQGQLSTTCLPNGGVIHGASIFEIAYMDYNGATPNKIYFYEVESGIMEAGMPYVVLANEGAAKFGVYYTDNANSAAQSKNGLVGYMGAQRALVENDYFIYDNKFYYVEAADAASGRIQIAPNRAYINLSQVPGYNHTPVSSHAPSSRVSLSNGAPQVSTGIDELNVSETPAKVIINGQLFILRGEKMFDATGRLVK